MFPDTFDGVNVEFECRRTDEEVSTCALSGVRLRKHRLSDANVIHCGEVL